MANKEFAEFKISLNKIYDLSYKNNGELMAMNEHLKNLNGKVATHSQKLSDNEKKFSQIYKDFRTREDMQMSACLITKDKFQTQLEKLKDDAIADSRKQEQEIWGVKLKLIGMVTIIITVISLVFQFAGELIK